MVKTKKTTKVKENKPAVPENNAQASREPAETKPTRPTFVYPVPETKEDYLALIKCIKDTGTTDVGGLEVRASRL